MSKKTQTLRHAPRLQQQLAAALPQDTDAMDLLDQLHLDCYQRAAIAESLELLLERAVRQDKLQNETDPIMPGLSEFMRRTAAEWREISDQISALYAARGKDVER